VSLVALNGLRRQRRLVIAALVLACLVGVAIPYRIGFPPQSRQQHVGIASASALVDSTRSQVANLGSAGGVQAMAYRASLLASLLTTPSFTDQIARRAGIAPTDLIAKGPPTVPGPDGSAPPVSIPPVTGSNPQATISVSVPTLSTGQIPIIQVNTEAPTPAVAANLANGAFAALEAQISADASTDNIPADQRVLIRPLGPAAATAATRGPGPLLGLLGAVLTFVLACGAILAVSSLRASLRVESAGRRSSPESVRAFRESPAEAAPGAPALAHGRIGIVKSDPVVGVLKPDPVEGLGAPESHADETAAAKMAEFRRSNINPSDPDSAVSQS
jgi:hypothetical protein